VADQRPSRDRGRHVTAARYAQLSPYPFLITGRYTFVRYTAA